MIKEKIDEVVNGTHIIKLDRDDFVYVPKAYIEFELDQVLKLKSTLPDYNYKLLDVVVAVSSDEDMELSEINMIVSEIEGKYNKNLNVIYGFKRNLIYKEIKVIIFVIN